MTKLELTNLSASPFSGWLRGSVATGAPGDVGITSQGKPWILGRQLGLRGCEIDVQVQIPAGTVMPLDLLPQPPLAAPGAQKPPLLSRFLKAIPQVDGIDLVSQGMDPTPGIWRAHLRARITPMEVVDAWFDLGPSQPWAQFRLRRTVSNPAIPDLTATVQQDFALKCGDAVVQFIGGPEREPWGRFNTILPAGWTDADGQATCACGVVFWPDLMTDADVESVKALCTGSVGLHDPEWEHQIGPLKAVASLPLRFSARSWAVGNYPGALQRLLNWQEGPLGITANSGQTGAEEEQPGLGKGAAVFAGGGFTAVETLRYVGYGFGRVPCHYREADGSPLSMTGHPNLMLWDGRPHKAMPDTLGKNPDLFGPWLSHGWWGPNDEHFFVGTLCSAYQLTGDPVLQSLIDDLARVWLYSDTVDPRMSTSGPRAARARGWASIAASWFWLTLEDRALADMVKSRYLARFRMYKADVDQNGPLVDMRPNDLDGNGNLIGLAAAVWSDTSQPSPYPWFWMGYQCAVMCGGIQIAGEVFDLQEAKDLAYSQALVILDRCFQQQGTGWVGWEVLGVKPVSVTEQPVSFVEGRGAHHSGLFDGGAWFALAVWTILRHDPTNAKALTIWTDWISRARTGDSMLEWFPQP